jgi:hypothetical protein
MELVKVDTNKIPKEIHSGKVYRMFEYIVKDKCFRITWCCLCGGKIINVNLRTKIGEDKNSDIKRLVNKNESAVIELLEKEVNGA